VSHVRSLALAIDFRLNYATGDLEALGFDTNPPEAGNILAKLLGVHVVVTQV
jgi:hypothetical protein